MAYSVFSYYKDGSFVHMTERTYLAKGDLNPTTVILAAPKIEWLSLLISSCTMGKPVGLRPTWEGYPRVWQEYVFVKTQMEYLKKIDVQKMPFSSIYPSVMSC